MTVTELKELLKDAPDNMDILVAVNANHYHIDEQLSGRGTIVTGFDSPDYKFIVLTGTQDLQEK